MYWAVVCSLLAVPPGPWEPAPAIEVAPPQESAEEATEPAAEASAPVPAPAAVRPAAPEPESSTAASPPAYPVSRWAPRWEAARLADDALPGGKGRWRPGVGVEVASANGRFSIAFNAFMQLQAMVLRTPGQAAGPFSEGASAQTELSLQLRRARVWFSGNVFTKNIKYRVALTFAPVELGFKNGVPHRTPILDWFFTFDRFRDFTVQVGQYKVPYNLQRMNKITSLQFVDRSLANNEFTLDRDIGLDLRSKDLAGLGKLRYYLGVYLGDGIAKYGPTDFGLTYLGRFEVLPFGLFDDLEESDLDRSMKPRLLIGAAYAFADRNPRDNHGFFAAIPLDGGATSSHNATADFNFKIAGFSLDGAFFWRYGWRHPGNAVDATGAPQATVAPRNGLGYFAQAGYLIPYTPLELGARWGQTYGFRFRHGTSLPNQTEFGGVLNLFFARHFLKFQLDYLRLYSSGLSGPADQVRLQLQATF